MCVNYWAEKVVHALVHDDDDDDADTCQFYLSVGFLIIIIVGHKTHWTTATHAFREL